MSFFLFFFFLRKGGQGPRQANLTHKIVCLSRLLRAARKRTGRRDPIAGICQSELRTARQTSLAALRIIEFIHSELGLWRICPTTSTQLQVIPRLLVALEELSVSLITPHAGQPLQQESLPDQLSVSLSVRQPVSQSSIASSALFLLKIFAVSCGRSCWQA